MNASCADWLCDRVRHHVSAHERVPSAARVALTVAIAGFCVACSEEQYNPTIGVGTAVAVAGSAGQSGSAGSGTNSSGTSSSGGSAGTAAGAGGVPGESSSQPLYAFQSSLEGFFINYYCTGPGANQNCTQLQAQQPAAVAGGVADAGEDAGAAPEQPVATDFFTLEQDAAVGDPEPGSAKLTLRFTSGTQSANFAINFGSGTEPGVDLAGKTVQARVRAEAGAPATTYAKMYIKTGASYYYADSGQQTLVAGSWIPITFAAFGAPSYPSAPDATLYTLSDVREIGMEFGATDILEPLTAAIHIDSVSY